MCAWGCGARRRPWRSAPGGLFGTGASDLARLLFGSPAVAYAAVFIVEAALFALAARQAALVFADASALSSSAKAAIEALPEIGAVGLDSRFRGDGQGTRASEAT